MINYHHKKSSSTRRAKEDLKDPITNAKKIENRTKTMNNKELS